MTRTCCLLAVLAGMALFTATVEAQPGRKSGAGRGMPGGGMPGGGMPGGMMPGAGGPGGMPGGGKGSMPPGGIPGGMGGGMMPGSGMMPGGGMPGGGGMGGGGLGGLNARKQKNLRGEELPPLPELKLDPNGLPAGFTPSKEPPEWMTTADAPPKTRLEELEAEEGGKQYRQQMAKIREIVRQNGVFKGDDEKKLVDEYVEYRLAQLTRPENRIAGKTPAHELQDQLFREIWPSNVTKTDKMEVRLAMANRVVALADEYLYNYHFVSRLQTAILLARLSECVEQFGGGPGNPDVHFTKGTAPLLALMKKDKTTIPAGVRTWGISGLVKLARLPELRASERSAILETLVEQLGTSQDEPLWNQYRLVEGLGQLKLASFGARNPVVAQAVSRVLVDEERDFLVRSEAAFALGQLNYESGVDLGLIAWEIGQLASQMAKAAAEAPDDRRWKLCFVKLYGAFKPLESGGQGLLTQIASRSNLASHKNAVTAIYDRTLPVISAGVKVTAKGAEKLSQQGEDLAGWLGQNPPKQDRIHSAEEPLRAKQPNAGVEAPAATPAAGG
jgi:hypothetical protein